MLKITPIIHSISQAEKKKKKRRREDREKMREEKKKKKKPKPGDAMYKESREKNKKRDMFLQVGDVENILVIFYNLRVTLNMFRAGVGGLGGGVTALFSSIIPPFILTT